MWVMWTWWRWWRGSWGRRGMVQVIECGGAYAVVAVGCGVCAVRVVRGGRVVVAHGLTSKRLAYRLARLSVGAAGR
jgi:hypothetical protein